MGLGKYFIRQSTVERDMQDWFRDLQSRRNGEPIVTGIPPKPVVFSELSTVNEKSDPALVERLTNYNEKNTRNANGVGVG